jgi:hypothetical protein
MHPDLVKESDLGGIPLLAVIEPDEALALNDIEGTSVLDMTSESKVLKGAREVLGNLGVI